VPGPDDVQALAQIAVDWWSAGAKPPVREAT
jgi:hypothetical protein